MRSAGLHRLDDFEVRSNTELAGLGLVVALCFLPYLNLGPLSAPSQVQPWASIVAWLWVCVRVARGGMRVSGLQILLLTFGLWFMIYVYRGDGFDVEIYARRSASFLLSAGIFLAVQYLTPQQLWRVLQMTTPIWFVFALLRYVAPGLYFTLVVPFVPTVVVSDLRGTSSLAPEATDFGFTMVFIVVFCMIARHCLREMGEMPKRWPLVLATASALLSLSGTGIFGLVLVGFLYLVTRHANSGPRVVRILVAAVVATIVLLILSSVPSTGYRGFDLLVVLAQSPSELLNSTASYRIAHNAVGLVGLFDSGFRGFGAGSFVVESYGVYSMHDLGQTLGLTGYYLTSVPATLFESPVSFIALILFEYGLVGLVYLVVVFLAVARSAVPYRAIVFIIMILAWAQSFPAAWPPFWVMLGLTMSANFRSHVSARRGQLERQ